MPLQPSWCSTEGRRGRWGWRRRTPLRTSRWESGQCTTGREYGGRPSWRQMMKWPCDASGLGVLKSQDKQALRSVCVFVYSHHEQKIKTAAHIKDKILELNSQLWSSQLRKNKLFVDPQMFLFRWSDLATQMPVWLLRVKISRCWRPCVVCVLSSCI